MWGQLAIRALVSGCLIAAASEIARRNPGWGGLVASLPLTSLIAVMWLWHDTQDPVRAADFLTGTTWYVIASLPAFVVMAAMLRKGTGFLPALAAGVVAGMAGYLVLIWAGRRLGLPV
jgi:hypothetical protein